AGPQSAVQAAHVPLARPALLTSTGTPAGRARKDNPISLFRPRKFSYRLPNGSYRTPDGRRGKKDTPGAVRVGLGRSEIWYGTYKAADGTRRKVPLCSSKEASKQLLAKLRVDAKLAEHGLGDAFEEHRTRPLAEHLAEWQAALEADGAGEKHVAGTI